MSSLSSNHSNDATTTTTSLSRRRRRRRRGVESIYYYILAIVIVALLISFKLTTAFVPIPPSSHHHPQTSFILVSRYNNNNNKKKTREEKEEGVAAHLITRTAAHHHHHHHSSEESGRLIDTSLHYSTSTPVLDATTTSAPLVTARAVEEALDLLQTMESTTTTTTTTAEALDLANVVDTTQAGSSAPTATSVVGGLVMTWQPMAAQQIVDKYLEHVQQEMLHPNESQEEEGQQQYRKPFMVAVVGIPGSGKSTAANMLVDCIQAIPVGSHDGDPYLRTFIMPHDGYHYPLSKLRTMPNADDLIYRRGAPDTFDAMALARDLHRITRTDDDKKEEEEDSIIPIPGFDHAVGDPTPAEHCFVRSQYDIVLCEGLYLLHDDGGWKEVSDQFDFTIFVDSDVDASMERLKIRNLVIPGYTPEEIRRRVEEVDRVNALTVQASRSRADLHVPSYDYVPQQPNNNNNNNC